MNSLFKKNKYFKNYITIRFLLRILGILIILQILFLGTSRAEWSKVIVDDIGGSIDDVSIGDGDNDGQLGIYATGGFIIFQWEWSGSSWTRTTVGSTSSTGNYIGIGDANNDGDDEVYMGNSLNSCLQFKWSGSSWTKSEVGSGGDRMKGIDVGDGDDNTSLELYAANYDLAFYQFVWSGSSWTKTQIGTTPGNSPFDVVVGDGDNDASLEVYGAAGGYIYQFQWTGTTWTKTEVGSMPGATYSVAIGDGDNDGELEIYAANNDHHIYQFKWNSSSWDESDIGFCGDAMRSVAVGDGDNDGNAEVYGASSDGYYYKFKWDGTLWNKISIGSGTLAASAIAVGNGRGDGKLRVYGGNNDTKIYEFTCDDSTSPVAITTLSALTGADEGTIFLNWTSPGDSGTVGTAVNYIIRFATFPILEGNWNTTSIWKNSRPVGGEYGFAEQETITDLTVGTTYYFAIKTRDEEANISDVSNSPFAIAQLDVSEPAVISNLTALAEGSGLGGQVKLKWTASGDNGMSGDNSSGGYVVRYATKYISTDDFYATWASTYTPSLSWTPNSSPGTEEGPYLLTGFDEGTTYFFAIRTRDSDNNWAIWPGTATGINENSYTVPTDSEPAKIIDLSAVTGSGTGKIDLSWTAPGDDGTTGNISGGQFWIKYSSDPAHIWDTMTYEWYISTSVSYGTNCSKTITGLANQTTYYFYIKTGDEKPNWSPLSDKTTAYTLDGIPPAAINDLEARPGPDFGEIELTWTATGDDENVGIANYYDIRYSSYPAFNWATEFKNALVWKNNRSVGGSAGFSEKEIIKGLIWGATYYFRIKVVDYAGYWSGLSNGATSWSKTDKIPPESYISVPEDDSRYRELETIEGTSFDNESGVDIVKICIINLTESPNRYWDGNDWVKNETWVDATGKESWHYDNPIWVNGNEYRVRSKAIDNANNKENSAFGNSFIFQNIFVDIFPNPFKPNSNLGHTVITFANLSKGSNIKVFTISGDLVWEKENVETDQMPWEVVNENGKKVVSGVYIYLLTDNNGKKIKIKNFAIIR